MMKKLVALMLVVLMTLTMTAAVAEIEMIGDTNLSLDLGDLEIYELTDEDAEDGVVLFFGDEDESMLCLVMTYDAEGLTLQELAEEVMEDDETITASGYTTINGIECFCVVSADDEGNYVVYLTVVDDTAVQFFFAYEEDSAELTGVVMNTLTLN